VLRPLHHLRRVSPLVAALALVAVAPAAAQPAVPQGVWLVDGKAAVQIYDCSGLMCGRVVWLKVPRNRLGQLDRDKHNPDPALRQRQLCGLTTLRNLHPAGPGRWSDGALYDPQDGKTYGVSAQLASANVITARIYLGVPLLGQNRTLVRVPRGASAGWC
jgi:uncharacterized protein (DUF2147 family)